MAGLTTSTITVTHEQLKKDATTRKQIVKQIQNQTEEILDLKQCSVQDKLKEGWESVKEALEIAKGTITTVLAPQDGLNEHSRLALMALFKNNITLTTLALGPFRSSKTEIDTDKADSVKLFMTALATCSALTTLTIDCQLSQAKSRGAKAKSSDTDPTKMPASNILLLQNLAKLPVLTDLTISNLELHEENMPFIEKLLQSTKLKKLAFVGLRLVVDRNKPDANHTSMITRLKNAIAQSSIQIALTLANNDPILAIKKATDKKNEDTTYANQLLEKQLKPALFDQNGGALAQNKKSAGDKKVSVTTVDEKEAKADRVSTINTSEMDAENKAAQEKFKKEQAKELKNLTGAVREGSRTKNLIAIVHQIWANAHNYQVAKADKRNKEAGIAKRETVTQTAAKTVEVMHRIHQETPTAGSTQEILALLNTIRFMEFLVSLDKAPHNIFTKAGSKKKATVSKALKPIINELTTKITALDPDALTTKQPSAWVTEQIRAFRGEITSLQTNTASSDRRGTALSSGNASPTAASAGSRDSVAFSDDSGRRKTNLADSTASSSASASNSSSATSSSSSPTNSSSTAGKQANPAAKKTSGKNGDGAPLTVATTAEDTGDNSDNPRRRSPSSQRSPTIQLHGISGAAEHHAEMKRTSSKSLIKKEGASNSSATDNGVPAAPPFDDFDSSATSNSSTGSSSSSSSTASHVPPPAPDAPDAPAAPSAPSSGSGSAGGGRADLLDQIQKGKKLKKVTTVVKGDHQQGSNPSGNATPAAKAAAGTGRGAPLPFKAPHASTAKSTTSAPAGAGAGGAGSSPTTSQKQPSPLTTNRLASGSSASTSATASSSASSTSSEITKPGGAEVVGVMGLLQSNSHVAAALGAKKAKTKKKDDGSKKHEEDAIAHIKGQRNSLVDSDDDFGSDDEEQGKEKNQSGTSASSADKHGSFFSHSRNSSSSSTAGPKPTTPSATTRRPPPPPPPTSGGALSGSAATSSSASASSSSPASGVGPTSGTQGQQNRMR